MEHLKEHCKVKEIVLGNVNQKGSSIPVSQGGFTAYVAFNTTEEALNFPLELEVDGETAKLWHRGKFECETCGEKGHTADYHDKLMSQREKANSRRQKNKERKRKREERKARGN